MSLGYFSIFILCYDGEGGSGGAICNDGNSFDLNRSGTKFENNNIEQEGASLSVTMARGLCADVALY
ncbi:MAG: hypothetical protein PHZ02_15355 [Desulfocapsaceae bacterium]|nr:hypothetical protein [Desulfocapsaceae bacterium]